MKEKLKLKGHVKATITRKDGKIEVIHDKHNIIMGIIRQRINAGFSSASNYALDSLFAGDGTPPTTGGDGIIIRTSTTTYMMDCTTTTPDLTTTTYTTKVTGVFTGAGTFISAHLGHNWAPSEFETAIADASGWTTATLGSSDTLTVEWTLSI